MEKFQIFKGEVKKSFIKALEQTEKLSFSTKEIMVKKLDGRNNYLCLAQKNNSGFPRAQGTVDVQENKIIVKIKQVEKQRGIYNNPLNTVQLKRT